MNSEQLVWQDAPDNTVVCYCGDVNKYTVVAAIQSGANSVKSIQEQTGAGIGKRCMELNPRSRCCHSDISKLIKLYGKQDESSDSGCSCGCCK